MNKKKLLVISALFCLHMSVSAQSFLSLKDVAVGKAIAELKQKKGYSFVYEKNDLDTKKHVTISSNNLEETIEQILANQNVSYRIQGKSIIISKQKEVQKKNTEKGKISIKGTVVDANGEPVIGATVKAGDSQEGTVTDLDGKFHLTVSSNSTLHVSYIGYVSQEVRVGNRQNFNIVMQEDQHALDEVVVIGYGTTTRKHITAAVDKVEANYFEDRPVANVTQALQGASPSLVIQRKSFDPNNDNVNINLRGVSTSTNNDPLVVIDGLIVSNGALNQLNPNDIESVSVLKDAGATAIYGSRSSNGVIIVTTKKGHYNEKSRIRFSSSIGWEDPEFLASPVKGYQNATLKNIALTNSGLTPEFTPEQIRDLYNHRNEESWFLPQIFRSALQQSHNVSIQGGSQKTMFMVSAGYYDQESNYVGSKDYGVQRYNMRSNITTEVGPVKLQTLLAFTRNNSISNAGSSLVIDAARVPPYYYYKLKEDGKYLLNNVLSEFNPLGSLEANGFNKYRNNDFVANLNAEVKIIDGLKLRGVLGVNVNGQHRYTRTHKVPYYYSADQEEPSRYANENYYTEDWNRDYYLINTQLLLDYNKSFGKHDISALFGTTNESYTRTDNEISVRRPNADLGTQTGDDTEIIVGGASIVTPESSERSSIISLLGRLAYNYDEKYYAELDFRSDASSKFFKKNRWNFFPSMSLGWRVTSEPWAKVVKDNFGDLKLRASYGVLGNQSIGVYDKFTRYIMYPNTYAYNNEIVTGAGFNLGDPDIRWEKTHTTNVGFDASCFHNALTFSFDYFYKRTVDILLWPVVPGVYGTNSARMNAGEMSNRGWELSVNYRLKSGSWIHNFSANIGDSFNKVESLTGGEEIHTGDEVSNIWRVGVPLGAYYGYKTAGHFQSYEEIEASAVPVGVTVQPGDNKYVDRNNDGIIDSKDRFILGYGFPRYTFGFTYSVEWKGIDFSIFAQGVGKRDMMIRGELIEPFHSNYSYVIFQHQLDFWTPTNTDARYPRLSAPGSSSSQNNYRLPSDMYMLNGAYMRLKNITLGYTLPKTWTKQVGIEKVRMYVTGQNLLTFSHNSFVDPETSEFNTNMSGGANSARNYPTLKYYGFGLDIEF